MTMATVPVFHPSIQQTVLLGQKLLQLINDDNRGVFVPMDIQNVVKNFLQAHHDCASKISNLNRFWRKRWGKEGHSYCMYGRNKLVPSDIRILVNNFLHAHLELVNGIENFMHRKQWEKEELETTKAIIEICPEILEIPMEFEFVEGNDEDDDKNNSINKRCSRRHCVMCLPLHHAALSRTNAADFVPLLAKIGLEYGVGGHGGGGGLLVGFSWRPLANTPLLHILRHDDAETIKALLHNKVLFQSDIEQYELVHWAAAFGSIQVIKVLVNVDYSFLWRRYKYQIPLHFCTKGDTDGNITTARYILKKTLEYYPANETIGGLFSVDLQGKTPLQEMIRKYGQEITWWDVVEESLPSYAEIPILHNVIKYIPDQILNAIKTFPDSVLLRDDQNRLPIHIALEAGLQWSHGLAYILNASRPYLKDKDPFKKVYPIILAASKPSCDLKTINYLLKLQPEHVIL